jgi:hypothetical protein
MSYTELILPMPEETLDSWKDGITKILEAGQHNSITVWNCQVLKNSEMNQPEYIEKYGIEKTVAYDYINYENENDWQGAPEELEIIRSTNTMTTEEVADAWIYGIFIREFHINGVTQIIARYLSGKHGISYRQFYEPLIEILSEDKYLKDIVALVKQIEYHFLKFGTQPNVEDIPFEIPQIYGSKKGTVPPAHFMKDILNEHVFSNIEYFRQIAIDMIKDKFDIVLPQGVIDFNRGYTFNEEVNYPANTTIDYNIITDEDEVTNYNYIPRILAEDLDEKITNRDPVMLFKLGLYKSVVEFTS